MAGEIMPIIRKRKRSREIRMSNRSILQEVPQRPPYSAFIVQEGGKEGLPILQLRLAWPRTPK
jgi:hypothetical protein